MPSSENNRRARTSKLWPFKEANSIGPQCQEQQLHGSHAGAARQRSNSFAEVGPCHRAQVESDPARTPDRQEGRRISYKLDAHSALGDAAIAYASEESRSGPAENR